MAWISSLNHPSHFSATLSVESADPVPLTELMPLAYEDMRALARQLLRRHRRNLAPHATSLVHEAYARLAAAKGIPLTNTNQLLRLAARAMRFVLVDQLRRDNAQKRGGTARRCSLDTAIPLQGGTPDLVEVDDALKRLGEVDAAKASLVELRFFGGLTIEEAAEALEISPATAKRHWTIAKAWLYRELGGS